MDLSVDEFGALFRRFLEEVVEGAPRRRSPLAVRLEAHLGRDPLQLPVTAARFAPFEHPDVQLAVDAYCSTGERRVEAIGVAAGSGRHGLELADALAHGFVELGPVSYDEYPIDVDERLACITFGVLLIDDDAAGPHALVVRTEQSGMAPEVVVEVVAADPTLGPTVLDALRRHMGRRSVYRGKVFELGNKEGPFGANVHATFLPRPRVSAHSIILPTGVLERIERRTTGFDAVSERLVRQGQRRRRGLLLYGPPGTGKTLTVRYLMGQLDQRTVIVLTGRSLAAIGPATALARRLQPSLLVLEDVDLVAYERSLEIGDNPLLFELLNELDGIGEDADLVVLLTTNRADLLEPALAARPGRVDLAVELPLPAEDERRRLLALYSEGVDVAVQDWGGAIHRTDGTPASFIEELVRTAALHAAQAGADAVTDAHVSGALEELLESGPITPRLLGARRSRLS